jgi:arylsulfatase A-like enzyme
MAEQPNILLIHADQHRGDCLGIAGHPVVKTPTLDSLAHNGTRFSHFYAPCPTCIAARRSLITGQSPQRNGLVAFQAGVPIPDSVPTLPGVLRLHGYQTYHVGRSMHQSPARKLYGFDDMEIATSLFKPEFNEYREWYLQNCPPGAERQGEKGAGIMHNDWTARPWHQPDYLHPTNWTVDRALRFMERRDPTRPYFLSVGFIAPHPPLQPPAFYFDRYLRTGVPDPVIGDWAEPPDPDRGGDRVAGDRVDFDAEEALYARAGYYGLITHLDAQLRRLLNGITGVTRDPNLIVVYLSDHGEGLGDHYLWRKSRAYEATARVPCIITAPARFGLTPGAVRGGAGSLADIMPTLLDMVGAPMSEDMDGCSLLPHLRGDGPLPRPFVHIEHAGYHHGLSDGTSKYIWDPATGQELLFDLQEDPQERRDLSRLPAHATALARWRDRLVAALCERPEGFVADGCLQTGRPYGKIIPGSPAAQMAGND